MLQKDFAGAVVVVSGGSSGLGRAICVQSASRGARAVVINYASNSGDAEETAALVREQGAEALVVQGDVGEYDDCQKIVLEAEKFGHIDVLFNNAGVTKFAPDHGDLEAVSGDDFMRVFRVNVAGAYQMIRAARPLLDRAPTPAAIVNTGSMVGATGTGSSVPYAASKGALTTLTLSMARALAPQIRVNCICPGFMDTPWFSRGNDPDAVDKIRNRVIQAAPLKVASKADDVAEAALFLASSAARHITGETLFVDAGAHLNATPLSMR
ncbi:MAG: SDR family oxidoreductase [Hyphomonas sp.]|nr:SDR family oxidoreductase [Hyphomonas sp.]